MRSTYRSAFALCGAGYAASPVAASTFARSGGLLWSSSWPLSWVPATGHSALAPRDLVVGPSSSGWLCGTSDDRPESGPDQLVLGWTEP